MTYRATRGLRAFVVAGIAAIGLAAAAGPGIAAQAPAADAAPGNAPASTTPSGQAYAIRFTRPVKVGDRYRYVSDATTVHDMTALVSGRQRTLRPSTVSIHFEAEEHILAVNDNGEPSKATYTIGKCTKRYGKSESVFLEPGRVLTAEPGRWKSRLQLDEGTLTIVEEMGLRAVVSLPNLKGITADDCFGSARPQHVGDSWPVNAAALAQWASQEGARVNPKEVSGTVKLKAVQTVDGVPYLLLQGRAMIQRWVPDPKELPPNTKFVEGTDEIKFTKLLPVDASGNCLTDSNSEKALMKLRTDDDTIGPDVLVDAKVLRTVGIKRTPLPATGTATATASGRE